MSPSATVRFLPQLVFGCVLLSSFVRPEFIDKGSTTSFACDSIFNKRFDRWTDPAFKRNDDHNVQVPLLLFTGDEPRPIDEVDEDWSVNATKNATTGMTTYTYHLENIGYEDAGIYVCDDKSHHQKNVTVIGDKVDCKDAEIETEEGLKVESACELFVDGPDEVDLDWYIDGERVKSLRKEVLPEHHSVTTMLDLTAQPEHHNQKVVCRYAHKGKAIFECEVPMTVTYNVQVKGAAKSVYHDDTVEAEILVIGNPWPGKAAITVASDDIITTKTKMDELESGYGVDVTVFVPLSKFANDHEVVVAVLHEGETLTSVPIKPPPKTGYVTFIVVIAVLVVVLILIVVGVIICVRRRNSGDENISGGNKDMPLAEQAA